MAARRPHLTNPDDKSFDALKDEVKEHGWILSEKVIPALEKIEKTLEDNMGGIKLASILNSKIISTVLGAMVMVGIYFVVKTGGTL